MLRSAILATMIAFLTLGSISFNITKQDIEELPRIGEAVETVFGVTIPDLTVNTLLIIFILRSTPIILKILKQSSESQTGVTKGLLELMRKALVDLQDVIKNNTERADALKVYLEAQSDSFEAQFTVLHQKLDILIKRLEEMSADEQK